MISVLNSLLCAALLLVACDSAGAAFDRRHAEWDSLLKQHVSWTESGHASVVDYQGMLGDRARLQRYLEQLSALDPIEFQAWGMAEQQAFLINAYNAFTVELILSRYPKLKSIKDLGGWISSPWKKEFFQLLGESRSLDDVEHGLLRGAEGFAEPRIHFAVNCASVGCPALRPEAYRGDTLDAQLADQTRRFLSDRQRNRASEEGLQVSKIFDWYEEDFADPALGFKPPLGFLTRHAQWLTDDPKLRQRIERAELEIGYTRYDWSLNDGRP